MRADSGLQAKALHKHTHTNNGARRACTHSHTHSGGRRACTHAHTETHAQTCFSRFWPSSHHTFQSPGAACTADENARAPDSANPLSKSSDSFTRGGNGVTVDHSCWATWPKAAGHSSYAAKGVCVCVRETESEKESERCVCAGVNNWTSKPWICEFENETSRKYRQTRTEAQ